MILRLTLIIGLLVGLLLTTQAQTNLPFRVPIKGYLGNVVDSDSLSFSPADTLKLITVESTASQLLSSLLTGVQPTLIRRKLKAVVHYATSASLPPSAWYRVKVDGQTRYDGPVTIGYDAVTILPSQSVLLGYIVSQLGVLQGTKADAATVYTQVEVTNLLKGYYRPVTVPDKASAILAATGIQPKIIRVLVDESDHNRPNTYIYFGDGQPLAYPLF